LRWSAPSSGGAPERSAERVYCPLDTFEDLQLLARLQRHDRLLPIRLLARHPPDPPDLSADVHHADFLDLDVQGALGRLPDLHLVGIGPHQKADLALTFPHVG